MVNVYTCRECGKEHITVNLAAGVTSMFINCRSLGGCSGTAVSAMYRVDQNLLPEWVWYKPDAKEVSKMDEGMKSHVERGGLVLRKATPLELEPLGYRFRQA